MKKTIAPFPAPKEFLEITGKINGGILGLRVMRRCWSEYLHLPANKIPPKTVRVKGKFQNGKLVWLQHRAVELLTQEINRLPIGTMIQIGGVEAEVQPPLRLAA